MNFSNPILICDDNEEFRFLTRDMLTRNGFFHVLEAYNTTEAIDILKGKHNYFVVVSAKELSPELSIILKNQKNFIVLSNNSDPKTISLSIELGVEHILTYPLQSRKLIEKINSTI